MLLESAKFADEHGKVLRCFLTQLIRTYQIHFVFIYLGENCEIRDNWGIQGDVARPR